LPYEADLGVDAFEPAVGQAVFDGGDDAVEMGPASAGKVDEGLEAATGGRAAPGPQVLTRFVRVDTVVETPPPSDPTKASTTPSGAN
jgi:hypothetical protein